MQKNHFYYGKNEKIPEVPSSAALGHLEQPISNINSHQAPNTFKNTTHANLNAAGRVDRQVRAADGVLGCEHTREAGKVVGAVRKKLHPDEPAGGGHVRRGHAAAVPDVEAANVDRGTFSVRVEVTWTDVELLADSTVGDEQMSHFFSPLQKAPAPFCWYNSHNGGSTEVI